MASVVTAVGVLLHRVSLPQRAVWPMLVVVRHIFRRQRLQLPLTNDQQPVGQGTTNAANPPHDQAG